MAIVVRFRTIDIGHRPPKSMAGTEPNHENYDMTTIEGAGKYIADWTHWIANASDEEFAEAGY